MPRATAGVNDTLFTLLASVKAGATRCIAFSEFMSSMGVCFLSGPPCQLLEKATEFPKITAKLLGLCDCLTVTSMDARSVPSS